MVRKSKIRLKPDYVTQAYLQQHLNINSYYIKLTDPFNLFSSKGIPIPILAKMFIVRRMGVARGEVRSGLEFTPQLK